MQRLKLFWKHQPLWNRILFLFALVALALALRFEPRGGLSLKDRADCIAAAQRANPHPPVTFCE